MRAALVVAFVLTGCGTEVVQLYECRCRFEYDDSARIVVFDTLATDAECQEAGRAFCPTVR